MSELIEDKWVKKYLKQAKGLADDNDACYSRKIGVVVISPDNTPVSFGYNGTVRKAPHTDSPEWLAYIWKNLLTVEDKGMLLRNHGVHDEPTFVATFAGKKQCPRRILNIPSGQRMELCNCAHAERNALSNANVSGVTTKNSIMYCWCGMPCYECACQIIGSRIETVVCLKTKTPDYSPTARHMFGMSKVRVVEVDEEKVIG